MLGEKGKFLIERLRAQTTRTKTPVLAIIFSPTHKRNEGRAPVWGSEFTSKAAALRWDSAETAAGLNVKLCVLVVVVRCELPLSGAGTGPGRAQARVLFS